MVVIDANVIIGLVTEGENSSACEALLDHDSEWNAPLLWRYEISNMLTIQERVMKLPRTDSLASYKFAERIIAHREHQPSIERILECAARTGCSGYDATYIVLAEELNVPLYTYDKRVLKACPHLASRP